MKFLIAAIAVSSMVVFSASADAKGHKGHRGHHGHFDHHASMHSHSHRHFCPGVSVFCSGN